MIGTKDLKTAKTGWPSYPVVFIWPLSNHHWTVFPCHPLSSWYWSDLFDVTLAFEGTSTKVVVVLHSCRYSIPTNVSLNLETGPRKLPSSCGPAFVAKSTSDRLCHAQPTAYYSRRRSQVVQCYSKDFFIPSIRILADLLGFSGALGIQLIVSSLQEEVTSIIFFVLPRIMWFS